MRSPLSLTLAALLFAVAAPASAQRQDTAHSEPAATPPQAKANGAAKRAPAAPADRPGDELTTAVWRPRDVPSEPHWHLLSLPERIVELVFAPVGVVVALTERYRLDRRIKDLLENDAGTILVRPVFKISTGDGLGGGLSLKLKRLFGEERRRIDLQGLTRVNGDSLLAARYRHSLPRLEGRTIELRVDWETDRDAPWFGIGNDTDEQDERVVRTDHLGAIIGIDLSRHGQIDVTGHMEVGYRRETIGTGEDATTMGLTEGDTVALPPGFDRTLNFLWLRLAATRDNRDTVGRPTRGVLTELEAKIIADTTTPSIGALSGSAKVSRFFEVFPGHRVVIAQLGFAGSTPLTATGEVPLNELSTLGRKTHLRGFQRGRFRDRLALWANLEYRWPVYEYQTTGVTLAASVFGDIGRVGLGVGDLVDGAPHVAGGFAFRVAHETVEVGLVRVGFSREGSELTFSLGSTL